MTHCRPLLWAALLTASVANAQCPDGTPPPCRGAVTLPLARRINPALNPRTWIVVPLGNVTKSPDLDWLRDASVNLLKLDLSRWTGSRSWTTSASGPHGLQNARRLIHFSDRSAEAPLHRLEVVIPANGIVSAPVLEYGYPYEDNN